MTTPGTKKSDAQKRVDDALGSMPNVGTREAIAELAKFDPVVWTMYMRRLGGVPLTFDMSRKLTPASLEAQRKKLTKKEMENYVKLLYKRHRPFMIDPLRDDHQHKVYKKGRQTGVSELSITETLCFLDQHPNTKWIYTFPRDTQLQQFAVSRIKPALEETPRMRRLLGVPNQVYSKRISDSFLILRSAWESNLGEGVDADGVTLDEKDRMKKGIDNAFRESLSSSIHGLLREVSTPTLPNAGVDATWLMSDMRYWFMKCMKCGMAQAIDPAENIVQVKHVAVHQKELPEGTYEYQCRKTRCRGPLNRLAGEWVAKRPDIRNVRGYHMPQTIAPWISATEVMQKRINMRFLQMWMNYVLAETSMGDNILLCEEDFDMADAGHQFVWRRTQHWPIIAAGIDWGNRNWVYVIGINTNGRAYILNLAVFDDDKQELYSVRKIDQFLEPFAPDIIVADAGYGKDRNAYLFRRYGEGRFFSCWYNPSEKGGRTVNPNWQSDRVTVDRTSSFKVMCRAYKEREIGLPARELEMVQALEKHLLALAPMHEEDEETHDIVEVIRASGDDHLAHASLYAYLGLDHLTNGKRFNFEFV